MKFPTDQASATTGLLEVLRESPGSNVRELARALQVEKKVLNRILYGRRDLFVPVGPQPPAWFIEDPLAAGRAAPTDRERADEGLGNALPLYSWQEEALAAWRSNNRRGIVEAVTGAGKTRLGLAAVADQLGRAGRAAIIVPTVELLSQWEGELSEILPDATIGLMGGGSHETLATFDVLVATGASARQRDLELPKGVPGLLVADECHRYGADVSQLALQEVFDARLGLSATYERPDSAHEWVLLPYFDRVVFTLGYRRAIDDGAIASFRVALLGVDFSPSEQDQYEEMSEAISRAWGTLVNGFDVEPDPFASFLAEVTELAKGGPAKRPARSYLKNWNARRKLMAETRAKLPALDLLESPLRAADRSFVFTQTVDSADELADRLNAHRIPAAALHAQMHRDERRRDLEAFADGALKVLTSVKVLEEGINVPAADLGVIMAASKQRRQMIQRMGRILRIKPDGRAARFVVVYVRGTGEDPALGAHEAFLEDLLGVADEVKTFTLKSRPAALDRFLRPE